MINCLLVDDNPVARLSLTHLISQIESLHLVASCENSLDAYQLIEKEKIDLLFLDIEMPEMNGIELIKNLSNPPLTILITSKKNYAIEAFELNVVDYIIKPITLPRFMAAVTKAKLHLKHIGIAIKQEDKSYIFVRSNGILIKIKIDDITYLQALGDYVNIYTNEGRYTVHVTLKAMQAKLENEKFYRLHRSYVIALNKVDKVEDGTAYIGKHPIPIGEQYKKELLQKINLI